MKHLDWLKSVNWPVFSAAAAWCIVILSATWVVAAEWSALSRQVNNQTQQLDDHEQRVRSMEDVLIEIKTDVRWIRNYLERTVF